MIIWVKSKKINLKEMKFKLSFSEFASHKKENDEQSSKFWDIVRFFHAFDE